MLPLCALEKDLFQESPAPVHSLAYGSRTPVSCSIFPCVFVSKVSFLIKTLVILIIDLHLLYSGVISS